MERVAVQNTVNAMRRTNSDVYRTYFQQRDAAYFRESKKPQNADGTPAHHMKDEKSDPRADFEIPTVFSQTDTARARLGSIFLSPVPIFKTVTPPDVTPIGEQYDAVIEADASRFGWTHQLSLCHLDALKYDIMVAEVEWKALTTTKVTRDEASGVLARNIQQIYAGNQIKHIHPSNAFWDTSVPLNEVSSRGDYAGYVEPYTLPKLLELLHSLEYSPAEIKKLVYPTEAQKRSPAYIDVIGGIVHLYQTPRVTKEVPHVTPEQSATYFDIPDAEISAKFAAEKDAVNTPYEVTTLYLRTIPAVVGLHKDSDDSIIPRLYKIIILNGCKFLSIEEANYNHNYLPMLFASAMADGVGHTSKSFSHNMESLQVLANKLIDADVKSSARAIADRAIYNPHMIDPRHANNPSSTAKIPLKAGSPSADVRAAYQSIPYSDPALGQRFQQALSLLGFGNEISGSNPIAQGQFVKGNKTNEQFQESMTASDSRLISMALGLNSTFYTPLKEILKHNIQQFQTSEASYSQSMERVVNINAEELRKMLPEFTLSDGLVAAQRILNTQVLTVAMQSIPAIPELAQEYNVSKMFMDLVSNGEGVKMQRYRYTEPEKQARMQQQQQQMQAEAQAAATAKGGQPQQQQPQSSPGLIQRMFGRG